ncbi:hypothetical protein ACVGVM_16635 [Pseudonocardia bannensis]|uniref:Phasin protein n=1 Tax=Pseudonocardia bannensis TaxID=630973 RepID=A0A848DMD5_9PSEU|nr:hypothetical protein [Pseudonocardia bannensis]NMH93715.1 hypothetical protein [Pseudonocardia bannensis]
MTAPTDQFVDIAKRSQEAVTAAVRTWADTVQTYAGSLTGNQPKLPDTSALVDRTFDFAEQVLENQRQITKTFFSAGAQAVEAVTDQAARAAESVTAHTVNATEAAADRAAEAGESAGEKVASTARAARNAAKS